MLNRDEKLKHLISDESYHEAVEIANCNPDRPLCTWYVEILNKTLKELSNFDLIRCIRQKSFTNQIVFEIIQRMSEGNTPLYADVDTVELMEKLSSIDAEVLKEYRPVLTKLFDNMIEANLIDKAEIWMYDEEKEEYMNYVNKIRQKIS